MTCMHSYLIWNISPSSLMFHRQKVPLCAFQSLLCPSDLPAYPCASHPFSCKCRAYPGCPRWLLLSLFIKHDHAPQVWCCLIHHEGAWQIVHLLDSIKNCSLVGCVHLANTHQDCELVTNLPPVETYLSSICNHQPSWNCQVIQLSRTSLRFRIQFLLLQRCNIFFHRY
jgi:hypothetical protein